MCGICCVRKINRIVQLTSIISYSRLVGVLDSVSLISISGILTTTETENPRRVERCCSDQKRSADEWYRSLNESKIWIKNTWNPHETLRVLFRWHHWFEEKPIWHNRRHNEAIMWHIHTMQFDPLKEETIEFLLLDWRAEPNRNYHKQMLQCNSFSEFIPKNGLGSLPNEPDTTLFRCIQRGRRNNKRNSLAACWLPRRHINKQLK